MNMLMSVRITEYFTHLRVLLVLTDRGILAQHSLIDLSDNVLTIMRKMDFPYPAPTLVAALSRLVSRSEDETPRSGLGAY
jgi:hypothetical protein